MNRSCESRSSCSNSDSSCRSVCFSTIEFHEHAMVLGNNPSTTEGPSLEIDWDIQDSLVIGVDLYEITRPPRRERNQLQIPCFIREDVLLSSGYSRDDINEQVRCMEKERQDLINSKRFPQKVLVKTKNIMAKLVPGRKTSSV